MCNICGKKSCSSCNKSSSGDVASLKNELSEIKSILDDLSIAVRFLKGGHPILALTAQTDIESFDQSSGLGSGIWEGWAVCNGVEQYIPGTNKKFTTENLIDRFIVGAGDQYDVGDNGGEDTHILTVGEMPAHSHTLEDPGHNHPITDDGHTHATEQDPHNHSFTGVAHGHALSINGVGDHSHETDSLNVAENVGDGVTVRGPGISGSSVSPGGSHSHTGNADNVTAGGNIGNASVNISVSDAATGIEVNDAVTGITMNAVGEGEPHENRPPYTAVLFVQKL